jgi:hypothetical protein
MPKSIWSRSTYRIDYRPEPVPRLGEADGRWADALLREAGRR